MTYSGDLSRLLSEQQHREPNSVLSEELQSRFSHDQPYALLDHHRLLVTNPHKNLGLLNDAAVQAYAEHGYKSLTASDAASVEPHVYEFATRLYYIMRRRKEHVSVILSGVSGSGKSTTHLHLLNELLHLSAQTKREDKIRRQITNAQTVIEALSGAATTDNMHASHFSQFQTLYFNERGRILGSYTAVYLLDKFRVAPSASEPTFNIFYQLLAGTTAQEKSALHINHPADYFAYLKDGQQHPHRWVQGTPSTRDQIGFGDFKEALKCCGFKSKTVAQICQLLAAILHLGNIQFTSSASDNCRIKNKEGLSVVAAALGVATTKLEATLTHKLKLLGKEFCTAFLTVDGAMQQRDSLARTLYTILVLWVVDQINQKQQQQQTPADLEKQHCIRILDPATRTSSASPRGFMDLCKHFCAERMHAFRFPHLHRSSGGVNSSSAHLSSLRIFQDMIPVLDRESARLQAYALDATDQHFLSLASKHLPVDKANKSFTIQHFGAPVEYSADGLLENNLGALSPDFILLFRYSCSNAFLRDLFESSVVVTETHPRDERTIIKAQLPSSPAAWDRQRQDQHNSERLRQIETVMDQMAHSMDDLMDILDTTRLFEIMHIRPNDQQKPDVFDSAIVQQQLNAFHLGPLALEHSVFRYTLFDFQERYYYLTYMLPDSKERMADDMTMVADECDKSGPGDDLHRPEYDDGRDPDTVLKLVHMMQWTDRQVQLDHEHIWIAFDVWKDLENHLRALEKEERIRERERRMIEEAERQAAEEAEAAAQAAAAEAAAAEAEAQAAAEADQETENADQHAGDNPFDDPDGASDIYTEHDFYDERTEIDEREGSPFGKHSSQWVDDDDLMDGYGPNMDMSKMVEDHYTHQEELIEVVPITRIRRWWARFVWFCTWIIPSIALKWIGKMHRQDVRMAWREKVTLCMLIFMLSASIIFFIVGLGEVICPGTSDLFTSSDVSGHQTIDDYWISVRGKVYDMTKFASSPHGTTTYMATKSTLEPLAGRDLSYTFPPPLTQACQGLVVDPSMTVVPNETIVLGPFVHYSGDQQSENSLARMRDPNWLNNYFEPVAHSNKKGQLVISKKQLEDDFKGWGRLALTMGGKVYDVTDYMNTARKYPRNAPGVPNYHFLDDAVERMFQKYAGTDATDQWAIFTAHMNDATRKQNLDCLNNAFYVAQLDYREELRCTFVNYLLLSFAVVMTLVVLVKFLAALQFAGAPTPEEQDKFVICQVPCYTEGEESLRKTIDSLTTMDYDDKRKLLFLIADGMIIGSGNDKPTPMILLDILGYDVEKDEDPEPVMFKSVGEGSKQLNYGKVYSGLYMHEGHTVPYIVMVKVGKSTEQNKPGNRGKRDSQIICMDFLRKVHFDAEMTPLELVIYHNIRNVIGIDPALYEYILMVDSDTEVYPDALTRLVSCMLHDSRIIGLCGETELCNEDMSWTTRIQVYEYYISHHLVKAFESLFGSVTCLPGCFCMYRIRTPHKRQPLIVSPQIIRGYSDNQVDTLHKKNLLHLGEDRYLTTLMMKNFPQYKIKFTPYARCRTVAPDSWQVLLSQRRRWINSTIHNLLELILLPELCGFCCLSMRFVVMIDLIGTVTLPASVIYLAYLIYIVASNTGPIPVIALGMLAGAYGLQALIFIFKRQWQHIGWMIIYLLAIPVFSFIIPIYAFWHFDDFSWGNTRVVVGDKQKQIIVTEDEKFDDKMIPMKKWSQYESEMEELALQEADDDERTKLSDHTDHDSYSHNDDHEALQPPRLLSEHNISDFSVDLSAALNHPSSSGPFTQSSSLLPEDEEHPSNPVLPEDEDIEREVARILAGANLMELTKKQVRDQLSQRFGVDLTIKKGFINEAIERTLTNTL